MTGTDTRIRSLDVTRGVAVMGIFSVNVVAMAMIQIAYFYPPAFGFDQRSITSQIAGTAAAHASNRDKWPNSASPSP